MSGHILQLPAITHNPWHPAYLLTAEGRDRVERELAPPWLAWAIEQFPGVSVTIIIGDRPMCGRVPDQLDNIPTADITNSN